MANSDIAKYVKNTSEQLRKKGYTHVSNSIDRKIRLHESDVQNYSGRKLMTETLEIIMTMDQSILEAEVKLTFIQSFFESNLSIPSSSVEVQSDERKEFDLKTVRNTLQEFKSIHRDVLNLILEARRSSLIVDTELLGRVK